VLSDATGLRAMIDSLLTRGLLDKADLGAFVALTTAGNFTAWAGVVGEAVGDSVARVNAGVVNAGGSGVIVCLNPVDYLEMTLRKSVDAGTYLGMPAGVLAARIAAVASVTAGHILAFAPTTGAAFADRQPVVVESGYTGTGFTDNRATVLCEARGSAFVRDPGLALYGPLPAAA
jgi:hypothetical protein